MAQPYFEGAHNAAIYGHKHYSVISETIAIDIRKDTAENMLYAVFKVHYKIHAHEHADLPLLFLALHRSDTDVIKVNGKIIADKALNKQNVAQFPFISKGNLDNGEQLYHAAYRKDESIVVKLEDLIYFNAHLHTGENDVYIEYQSDFGFSTYGFLKNYRLRYSLYPSKYWKSFGPITVNLRLNGLADITKSNLGKAKIKNDIAQWTLHSFDSDLDITINHKTSVFGQIVLFLHPFGIALLFLTGFISYHCRLLKRYPSGRPWIFWLGIFIVPALFYATFFLSFDFIEWVLGYTAKHGYVFLYIFTYPIFVLLYGFLLFLWKQKRRSKSIHNE